MKAKVMPDGRVREVEREGVPALTAERGWPDIAAAAGVTVDLIR